MSKQPEDDDQFADSHEGETRSEMLAEKQPAAPALHDNNETNASTSSSRQDTASLYKAVPNPLAKKPPSVSTMPSQQRQRQEQDKEQAVVPEARPLVQPTLWIPVNDDTPDEVTTTTNSLQHVKNQGKSLQERGRVVEAPAKLPKHFFGAPSVAAPPADPAPQARSPELAALEQSYRMAHHALAAKQPPLATGHPPAARVPLPQPRSAVRFPFATGPPPAAAAPLQQSKSASVKKKDNTKRQSPKKRKKRATTHDNVQVIPVSPIETQVCRAARLVANELENGGWPEVSPGARRSAATALEEFARTIFLPNLLPVGATQMHVSNERVFLATMLALREVLTQNARSIFRMQDVSEQEEQHDSTAPPGAKRRKREFQEEERQYMAQLFGTGVVFAAIQSTSEAESCLARFTDIMDSYDTGNDEFYYHMKQMNGRHSGVTPNDKLLQTEENVAWKVSFNRARELHPVVCRNRQRVEQQEEVSHSIQVARPNAVFVSMVEQMPRE